MMNAPTAMADEQFAAEGHRRALDLLRACSVSEGFLASPTDLSNYQRVWARDGVILGLAALMSGQADLRETCRRTLETLARYQGPHGEIPSNVDPVTERISYGGTTGRVDADLWFVIGCGEYWQDTKDDEFLHRLLPAIEKVRFLLGAWEFNNRGLLYIPQTGDWADEYVHAGYVLYDQLLYLQVLRTLAAIRTHVHGSADHALDAKKTRLAHLIRVNYWIGPSDSVPEDAYHEVLYRKGRKAACHCEDRYWLPFFSPHGYGYRFDSLANVLVSLLGVADDDRRARVDEHIEGLISHSLKLLPAFHPVITPVDEDWQDLQTTFSYTFKNKPYEYHNGGLWPMITGFYVADLARRGRREQAQAYLTGIHQGNALEEDGKSWTFPEFVQGQELTPGGTLRQGWSAAAAVIGHEALNGKPLFRITEHEK